MDNTCTRSREDKSLVSKQLTAHQSNAGDLQKTPGRTRFKVPGAMEL
jgi:hypothetical protein